MIFFGRGQKKKREKNSTSAFIKQNSRRGEGKGKRERFSFLFFSLLSSLYLSTMASREEEEAAAERAFTAIGMAPSTVQ